MTKQQTILASAHKKLLQAQWEYGLAQQVSKADCPYEIQGIKVSHNFGSLKMVDLTMKDEDSTTRGIRSIMDTLPPLPMYVIGDELGTGNDEVHRAFPIHAKFKFNKAMELEYGRYDSMNVTPWFVYYIVNAYRGQPTSVTSSVRWFADFRGSLLQVSMKWHQLKAEQVNRNEGHGLLVCEEYQSLTTHFTAPYGAGFTSHIIYLPLEKYSSGAILHEFGSWLEG